MSGPEWLDRVERAARKGVAVSPAETLDLLDCIRDLEAQAAGLRALKGTPGPRHLTAAYVFPNSRPATAEENAARKRVLAKLTKERLYTLAEIEALVAECVDGPVRPGEDERDLRVRHNAAQRLRAALEGVKP